MYSKSTTGPASGRDSAGRHPLERHSTQHTAYRCEYGSSYCSSVPASYYSSGTTREVEDVMRTLTGGYPPCSHQGKYYVVASHPVDGVSLPSGIQPVVCL